MKNNFSIVQKIGLVAGPVLFLLLCFDPYTFLNDSADKVIALAVWMVIWWITEVVSISVTALLPLTILPLIDVADIKSVASSYGSPIVFLFFGGFIMALALEKVNLHKRIALLIIKITGTSPDRVILGFMIATAFLSMWISNTATTVVMLPIAISVINLLANDKDGFTSGDKNFALSIMLGIAYSANVGGIATIIGTPPNTVMVGFMESTYDIQISFLDWMVIGLPFSLLMLAVIYFALVKFMYPNSLETRSDTRDIIKKELSKLGRISKQEYRVLIIFILTMSLWIFRVSINKYLPFIKLSDAGISMLAAISLFAIPFNFQKGEFTLEWEDTKKLPWGILILFGGGLALASALASVGVIDYIGELVSRYDMLPAIAVTALLIAIVLFMTELMSNVALVAIFCPVVAGIALGIDQELLMLLIPTTMAASCAFMLPMATPPNAIVFASGYIKVSEMARVGIILNFISILILIAFSKFVLPLIF